MIGSREAEAAFARMLRRLEAGSPGPEPGQEGAVVLSFAGSGMDGIEVTFQLQRIGDFQDDPAIAGMMLAGFWFGWELGLMGGDS